MFSSINPNKVSGSIIIFNFSKPHKSNSQMASIFPISHQNFPSKLLNFQSNRFPCSSSYFLCNPTKFFPNSAKKTRSDSNLASDFASEIEKKNTQLAQKEEAMKKSGELLFKEVCNYLGMKDDEVRKKWNKMNEDEKLGLSKEFVLEWGVDFHPLSAKSVKEMVDKYIIKDDYDNDSGSDGSSASVVFPGLLKFLGFSQNK